MHEDISETSQPGVGDAPSFLNVVQEALKFAKIPRPILIRGERGTGKELMARFIHASSDRCDHPYVVVNCAAFQEELFVAEMFGHEKGAFTGATRERKGKLELAHGGTLFLDEVANMTRSAQEKLLRVIEYQKFERVGGSDTLEVDVRVIAATNCPLEDMMSKGDFLPDLYDRLCFAELQLPPLRKRREDIPHLIEHFVRLLHIEIPNLEPTHFTETAIKELQAYHWPGNIRQLKNVIERLYVSDEDNVIHAAELPLEITTVEPLGGNFKDRVRAFEQSLLLGALKDAKGNQREAAKNLGLSYDQLRHYYKKYNLGELLA
ncbi:MAG: sigma 54-interacting transcriptional regulator [Candidatus Omnitrophica bacterium]|nr:sigma 54-interacting transcriptional regulator [Candidatus Omnitrophota bacterium]MCA9425700.1 sigma 54-interacting transcriptional regulator [Candidatus Omnitrophota bacterium]MCA9436936.1 sigma 54-interacting transcriptional regulator [Candidatus Omnitrophota bacterium]MCB9768906.1 sigma 54-interacting transcriptional regulator [Candidatus Omnitrophota bacterium]MCB9783398.1 sigma 54-interacting transcriptional regulator [Candidatus Omnitrophota bacterium]